MKNKSIYQVKIIKSFLKSLIILMIKFQLFDNRNKFKPGDRLKYNWKAKVMIWPAIYNDLKPKIMIKYLCKNNSTIKFNDGDSCDPFWVSKA